MSREALSCDVRIRVVHSSELDAHLSSLARALLDSAFDGDFSDADWEHSLGGLHFLAERDAELLGHAALVQRTLHCGERALCTGYVEGLAVDARVRRRGIGERLMQALEDELLRGFQLGALSATDDSAPLYAKRGWRPWRGRLAAITPEGVLETPEEKGGIFVFGTAFWPDLEAPLLADYRRGDVW